MRVFVTGATGFVGSAVVQDLLAAGHQALGLVRSDASAAALEQAGGTVHRGSVEDLDSLRRGAANADGVIHTAFIHDFSNFVENCEIDRRAVTAMGEVLAGSDRPLIITSGTGAGRPGTVSRESDRFPPDHPNPRIASEQAADAVEAMGVKVMSVRLPQVHGPHDHGFVPILISIAREKGAAAYVGDGKNRWPAVHRLDAARVYRLALEKGTAGARYNAIAEEGVSLRALEEAIGRHLNLPVVSLSPEEAADYYGWFADFASMDIPASSDWTRQTLGWAPTGPDLMTDLENEDYFQA
jgi:nucleoside-diphosphate-sugar epimerase